MVSHLRVSQELRGPGQAKRKTLAQHQALGTDRAGSGSGWGQPGLIPPGSHWQAHLLSHGPCPTVRPQRPHRGVRAPPGGHPVPLHVPQTCRTGQGASAAAAHSPQSRLREPDKSGRFTRPAACPNQKMAPEEAPKTRQTEDPEEPRPGPAAKRGTEPWTRPGGAVTWRAGLRGGQGPRCTDHTLRCSLPTTP